MQSVCDSGQCSSDGICSAPPASSTFSGSSTSGGAPPAALSLPRTNAPPSLQLAVPQLASVSVKRGAAYEWCGEGQDATASAPCEPGATAADDNDADIQSKVCGMPQADMFYVESERGEAGRQGVLFKSQKHGVQKQGVQYYTACKTRLHTMHPHYSLQGPHRDPALRVFQTTENRGFLPCSQETYFSACASASRHFGHLNALSC